MKTKTVTLIELDDRELDDTITKFLKEKGIKWPHKEEQFECIAEHKTEPGLWHEWGNDQSHSFTVDGEIDEDDKQSIMDGELAWQAGVILNWMASEDRISKGEYKVNVCW